MKVRVTFSYKSAISRIVEVNDPDELYDLVDNGLRDSITDEEIISGIVDNDWDWEYE